jgi:SAM-dependent methyltransferase
MITKRLAADLRGEKQDVSKLPERRARCNICGSTEFKPGPGGRLYQEKQPVCSSCGSLERHRVYRNILGPLVANGEASGFRALQFSRDPSIDRAWFSTLENSVYGHDNSLDVRDIELPSGSHDVVICNHVIEHVDDDAAAFREIARITSRRGFAFVSVPNPAERPVTVDWGYPDWSQHGHHRIYGYDLVDRLMDVLPDVWIVLVKGADPVTGREDMGFIISHQRRWHDLPIQLGLRAKSVNQPD